MSDLPPLYTNTSTQPHTLPLYTESPTPTERVLHTTASEPTVATRSLTRQFIFKSDHLQIDLGQFPCALMHPAYGVGGVVEGTIKITAKCTHVSQLTIKLQGAVTTTASEYTHVAIAGLDTLTLFSKSIQLVPEQGSGGDQTIDAGATFPFAIAFPPHVSGRNGALPPSYTAIHSGVSSEIQYYIQVDISRKGMFRRNEVRKIPVLFLPKSRPAMPAMYELPRAIDALSLPERVKETMLLPTWPETCEAQAIAEVANLPTVKLWSPIPQHFASGDYIPLAVNISCPSSPALAKLYASDVTIQLVKKRRIWFSQGRLTTARQMVLSAGISTGGHECIAGTAFQLFRLKAGSPGREVNISVKGTLEVEHVIRVTVRPPADVRHLPTFTLDEPIELTTDPYEDQETVLLTETHAAPALGLTTLRPQCAQMSLIWT
ncbi:hypothetical protein BDY19DRAFT_902718 [Irpex rosettiformis]|uniref:Uncharacterized protein n=1 Tax=Irpex rosettiformis TaxID=378272 RepID=A0ACB8UI45_9APHY|nr:hypothetical protein BDY19DRAFT_902718 [Irpex rosettiformis]